MKIVVLHRAKTFLGRILLFCYAFTFLSVAVHARAADVSGRLITSAAIAVNSVTHKVYAVDEGHQIAEIFFKTILHVFFSLLLIRIQEFITKLFRGLCDSVDAGIKVN